MRGAVFGSRIYSGISRSVGTGERIPGCGGVSGSVSSRLVVFLDREPISIFGFSSIF